MRARCQKRFEMRRDGNAPPTKFGEVIKADHKNLSENSDPRLQHRFVMVVQNYLFLCAPEFSNQEQERR